MRIAIVSNTYPPADISGVASLVYEMAHRFGGSGHHVRVLTREVEVPDDYAVAVGGSKKSYPWNAAVELWRRRKERFDVIHVHESDGYFVVWLWWLCKKLGFAWAKNARLVATLQVSYDKEREMIRPVEADGEVVARPTADEENFAGGRARVHAGFGKGIVRRADQVVAPSRETAKELAADYGAKNVVVIYNGIDPEQEDLARAVDIYRARLERGEAGQTVIYAGRMRNRKAVAVLLVAFRKVLNECPDARLVLVGTGEQYEHLVAKRDDLGLDEKQVEFLGQKPRAEVFGALARADVYCLPTLYEGFPVATLEAMAIGLPVVTTPVSGNPEAVKAGVHGLLVPKENATALAEALVKLLSDPEKRHEMGRRGRERVLEEFTIETIAADYLKLWQNLVPEDTQKDVP